MARLLTGKAPRLSKAKTARLRKAGIVLKRNAEGTMYFRCSYRKRFSTFQVTRKGETRLQSLSYKLGDEIDRHVVQDLHDFGYIVILRPDLSPSSPRPKPRVSPGSSQGAKVGHATSPALRSEIAQLVRDTQAFDRDRKRARVRLTENPRLQTKDAIQPVATEPSPTVPTRSAQGFSPRSRGRKDDAATTALSEALARSHLDASSISRPTVSAKEQVIEAILAKLSAAGSESAAGSSEQRTLGVPRKHLKKAAKRKRK